MEEDTEQVTYVEARFFKVTFRHRCCMLVSFYDVTSAVRVVESEKKAVVIKKLMKCMIQEFYTPIKSIYQFAQMNINAEPRAVKKNSNVISFTASLLIN